MSKTGLLLILSGFMSILSSSANDSNPSVKDQIFLPGNLLGRIGLNGIRYISPDLRIIHGLAGEYDSYVTGIWSYDAGAQTPTKISTKDISHPGNVPGQKSTVLSDTGLYAATGGDLLWPSSTYPLEILNIGSGETTKFDVTALGIPGNVRNLRIQGISSQGEWIAIANSASSTGEQSLFLVGNVATKSTIQFKNLNLHFLKFSSNEAAFVFSSSDPNFNPEESQGVPQGYPKQMTYYKYHLKERTMERLWTFVPDPRYGKFDPTVVTDFSGDFFLTYNPYEFSVPASLYHVERGFISEMNLSSGFPSYSSSLAPGYPGAPDESGRAQCVPERMQLSCNSDGTTCAMAGVCSADIYYKPNFDFPTRAVLYLSWKNGKFTELSHLGPVASPATGNEDNLQFERLKSSDLFVFVSPDGTQGLSSMGDPGSLTKIKF